MLATLLRVEDAGAGGEQIGERDHADDFPVAPADHRQLNTTAVIGTRIAPPRMAPMLVVKSPR